MIKRKVRLLGCFKPLLALVMAIPLLGCYTIHYFGSVTERRLDRGSLTAEISNIGLAVRIANDPEIMSDSTHPAFADKDLLPYVGVEVDSAMDYYSIILLYEPYDWKGCRHELRADSIVVKLQPPLGAFAFVGVPESTESKSRDCILRIKPIPILKSYRDDFTIELTLSVNETETGKSIENRRVILYFDALSRKYNPWLGK